MKTLKDIKSAIRGIIDIGTELGKERNYYEYEQLKQAAIERIKSKSEWLLEQPSMFRLKRIKKRYIEFEGFAPEGNESEERAKGWIMGLISFFNITMKELK